jgi:hypothetical protein
VTDRNRPTLEYRLSGLRLADCLIEPDIAGYSYVCFRHHKELIALGEVAAEAKIPDIRTASA